MKVPILLLFGAITALAQPATTITINQTRANGGTNGNCLKVNANGTVGQVTGCGGGGGAGTVTSVSGTANEIAVANPTTTPVVSIVTSAALPGSPTTTTQVTGDASTKVSTTSYVANALASINPAVSVEAATTGVLSNTPSYNNGTAGVGATLSATTAGVLTVDGYSPALNEPILVKNQASSLQNGIYTLTTVGTGGVSYILTRRTDYNSPTNINYTGTIPVLNGSTNANTGWNLTTQIAALGTDPLTYTQAAAGSSSGPPGGNVKGFGALSNHCLVIGQGGKTIATIPCGTSGQSLVSKGSTTDPAWQNVPGCTTSTVMFSATPVYDLSLGCLITITLTANVTSSTVTNPVSGTTYTFLICQNGTGNFTHVWPASFIGAMTIGLTASECSTQAFVYNGTSYYAIGPGVVNE